MPFASPILVSLVQTADPLSHEAMARYSIKPDQAETEKPASLLARALLRGILCRKTDTPPEHWAFPRGRNGKPQAFFQGTPSSFAISISHSGNHVAVAAGEAEALGIDIETRRDTRDIDGVSALAFGPQERVLVAREGLPAFYRIWTLREAHAKATGAGLAQAADRTDRFIAPLPAGPLHRTEIGKHCWHIAHDEPVAGLSLALAVKLPDTARQSPVLVWR